MHLNPNDEAAAAYYDVMDILSELLVKEQRQRAMVQLRDRSYEYEGIGHSILGKAADHVAEIERLSSPELQP